MPTENENKVNSLIDVGEEEGAEINLDDKGEPEKVEAPAEDKIEVEQVPEDKSFENERETKLEKKDEVQEYSEGVQKRIAKLTRKMREAERQREAALELSKYHPDFEEIKESDDFHDWADAQPMEIKKWIYENNSDGKLASRAIDLYKKDRGLGLDKKTETKRKSKSEGADLLVKTNEQAQIPEGKEVFFKRSDIAKMSDAEFMQYEKEIVKAQREGRLID